MRMEKHRYELAERSVQETLFAMTQISKSIITES